MIIDSHNHVGADIMFWLRGDFPYAQHLVTMTYAFENRRLFARLTSFFPRRENAACPS